ncbi:hypothetical protein ACFL6O_03850 [candidate division KSB1 bacterium]
MKTIWYFVGLILAIVGAILIFTDIYYIISPAAEQKILEDLHSRLWWGAIMLVAGIVFLYKNKGVTVE